MVWFGFILAVVDCVIYLFIYFFLFESRTIVADRTGHHWTQVLRKISVMKKLQKLDQMFLPRATESRYDDDGWSNLMHTTWA